MTSFWQAVENIGDHSSNNQEVEFRLYYDKLGVPLFYTTENEIGEYITVDRVTYAQADYTNIRVRDGKIVQKSPVESSKLVKSNNAEGVCCVVNDVSIVDDKQTGQYWKLKTHEYR